MNNTQRQQGCGCDSSSTGGDAANMETLPIYKPSTNDEPCCGPPAGPPSGAHERPGYQLLGFVEGFVSTATGPVPQIRTQLSNTDSWGALNVRLGLHRNDYKVAPGLYAVGKPDEDSPVLVTANYKLSFDHLRKHLNAISSWLLVLDTRGINVWCAAGKGTFGTQEVIQRVQANQLAKVVRHRTLILPQLGAPGVAAQAVKKGCGFEVKWGPIRAEDVKDFLHNGMKAPEKMRRVTFTTLERLVLVPVEISLMGKYFLWALISIFILSGVGAHLFSLSVTFERAVVATTLSLVGIVSGCALVPLLLPWIPGRAFAWKGALVGLIASVLAVWIMSANPYVSLWPGAALVLFATAISSYAAMNFTGTTPYTSPSGVEKEMRRAIPMQSAAILVAVVLWVGTAF